MYRSLLLLLFIFIFINTNAQTDTVDYSKFFSQESKLDAISKTRNLLMDYVLSEDKTKAKDAFNYLTLQLENDNYLALYPSEKWLISFWLQDFYYIISEVSNSDSAYFSKLNSKVKPREDQLYRMLANKVFKRKETIIDQIKTSSALTTEDQEFLLLTLKIYTDFQNSTNEDQEKINKLSNNYLNSFPNGKFEPYVRNFYRYEYRQKNFQFGMEFYTGAGVLTGKLENYFSSGFAFGFGLIWGYNNLILNTRACAVIGNLKQDIYYKGKIWKQNDALAAAIPEISASYKVTLYKKLNFSPILGISWYLNSPSEQEIKEDESLKDVSINSKVSPVLGADLGWDFKNVYYYNYFYQTPMHYFSSINIRYTYQPVRYRAAYSHMDGAAHTITLSYKFGFGGAQRDL